VQHAAEKRLAVITAGHNSGRKRDARMPEASLEIFVVVPELTRNACIQLNGRISSRRHPKTIT
jgi:hypothetical protein